ncbi:TIR domain-containing protein [Streptomyces sp. AC550_RSS872]|uniref:TIR domain-containing protein n=1 Tax=Streptomyces sp. AC550_RSS872 TaxID=2823689 RepID=UPI001C26CF45|nr:TIR domain-containing protein [Streptomyces sp. AC550_RSS872]
MPYRNKTYVAFASEDIYCYRLMEAWRDNRNIEFNFFDAHDINTALDASRPETIRRRLGERLSSTKQTVVLLSDTTRPKAARPSSFLYYEIEAIKRRNLPVVFVDLKGSRVVERAKIPATLINHYSINVSFQPAIIRYALDEYVPAYMANPSNANVKTGPHYYKGHVYARLGL